MTSLHSRTRVCRHTVACGRLTGGMGPGASPGASPFLPGAFFGEGFGVLLRSAARRACVLLSCRLGRVFPGWRAWWVGWRFGRLLRIFLTRCAIWYCYSLWLLAPSGSLCGVLRGVEALVRCWVVCVAQAREGRVQRVSRGCLGAMVVARCCVVFAVVLFFCYRGCVPGWLPGCRGACFLN